MPVYAAKTQVSPEKSRAEIERILARYGAKEFGYITKDTGAQIIFSLKNHCFCMNLVFQPLAKFSHDTRGKLRQPHIIRDQWEQATRQSWRALALVVKAKLEAVKAGISTIEDEFFAQMLLPSGKTIGEHILPQIQSGSHGLSLSYKESSAPKT